MTSDDDNLEEKEAVAARKKVDDAIRRLGIVVIDDKQLDTELDKLISEFPVDVPFGKLMGEARRRFLYRADLDKVAAALKEKKKVQGSFRQGSARWH